MRISSWTLRRAAGFLLAALLLTAAIGAPDPAAAQFRMGGFGPVGGFRGHRFGGGPWRYPPAWAMRRFVYRPCAWSGRSRLTWCPGHRAVIGRIIVRNIDAQAHRRPRGGAARHWTPPSGERRFVPGEVITELLPGASAQAVQRIARRYDLTLLEWQRFPLIGGTLYLWRVGGGRSVTDVLGALGGERLVASAQPNYLFTLQEQPVAANAQGDDAQYVLGKLQVVAAHRLATGKNVLVALIDSQIDARHPDLYGAMAKSFDALGGGQNPAAHGTAMAGAIAAHGRLLGIAPGVRLLAARAFKDAPGGAMGTSFAIYKCLQWAADRGARVVNMSFVGPADPDLHRMLAAAYVRDMVLIAAAGNAGANSAPLYPAADPDVIAVTATDSDDKIYQMANRGRYIAVAAPGVEILAIAPGQSYQVTTGTSVAAAHISGVAALLLERKPSLKPGNIRAIIVASAEALGLAGRTSDLGTGLANAYRALMLVDKSFGKTAVAK